MTRRAALMEVVSRKLLALAESKQTFVDKAKDFAGRVNYFRGLGMIADFGIGMALGIPPDRHAREVLCLRCCPARAPATMYGELKKDVSEPRKGCRGSLSRRRSGHRRKRSKLSGANSASCLSGLNTSLVLFIDNLDRCLPDVAIGTLEAIRLFLFMPRTAFVIAADEDMIRHSVAKHFNDPERGSRPRLSGQSHTGAPARTAGRDRGLARLHVLIVRRLGGTRQAC